MGIKQTNIASRPGAGLAGGFYILCFCLTLFSVINISYKESPSQRADFKCDVNNTHISSRARSVLTASSLQEKPLPPCVGRCPGAARAGEQGSNRRRLLPDVVSQGCRPRRRSVFVLPEAHSHCAKPSSVPWATASKVLRSFSCVFFF